MKKIAIIGAGISGLFIANLFKKFPDYQITIYEKNTSTNLDEGYGVQLSINSIKLLNKIGFNTLEIKDKFNPEKIDFYKIKKENKICDLNISEFNSEDCKYTTIKRSKLVEFLKYRLNDNIIKYDHNIVRVICDYLIISDGVFSKGKSLISNNRIKPIYNNSIAIRANIQRNKVQNLNLNNISLFMGHNFHYVIYPVNQENEELNFIGVLEHHLTANEVDSYSLFKEKPFIQGIKDKLRNILPTAILDNIDNIKCFPVFVSKGYLKPGKNIFLLGDAFFAFPPSFAQGASQSIESASELFDNIINNKNHFYDYRVAKVKMINNRSKLNHFAFHVSNPLVVFFRNISLKLLTKNKKFLENYLGKVYKN